MLPFQTSEPSGLNYVSEYHCKGNTEYNKPNEDLKYCQQLWYILQNTEKHQRRGIRLSSHCN